MNKEDLKQYKMHPQRAKELTGVKAELYVLTFNQLQEVINKNAVLPLTHCNCTTCLFSSNGKHSCNRFTDSAEFKPNCKKLGIHCGNDNDWKHYIPFRNYR